MKLTKRLLKLTNNKNEFHCRPCRKQLVKTYSKLRDTIREKVLSRYSTLVAPGVIASLVTSSSGKVGRL